MPRTRTSSAAVAKTPKKSPPPRSIRPACVRCGDRGYSIFPSNKFALAELCFCHTPCRSCHGIGYVLSRDAAGRDIAEVCACRKAQKSIAAFNACQIPQKYWDITWEGSAHGASGAAHRAQQEITKTLQSWKSESQDSEQGRQQPKPPAPTQKKGILLHGGVGSGKTRLVCALLRYFLNLGLRARFVEFSVLLSEIKQGYDRGVSETELLDTLVDVDVLAIDELGKGRGSEWEGSILDSLVARLYNSQKVMLCTTNYPDKQKRPKDNFETLADRLDNPRIYSRLREMCNFVALNDKDHRLGKDTNAEVDTIVM